MSPARRLSGAALLLAASVALAGEPRKELLLDGPAAHQQFRTLFADYGDRARTAVVREKDGLRLSLPKGSAGQTGVYSLFVLSGDCEVALSYELLSLPRPTAGYGSGVGLALDAGEGVGRGTLQRIVHPKEGSGYAFQTNLGAGPKPTEEYRFVKTAAKRGWMGLRREKNELVFLTSDDLAAEMKEVGRLPFPEGTVRAVRFFADAGGSPTSVDARLRQVRVRAEEITGGVPEAERRATAWWWWPLGTAAALGAGLLLWRWRVGR
jgi:hypothetical protein